LPHLFTGSRSPAPKLGLYKIFNYILKDLYLGCQRNELPIHKDGEGHPETHYTRFSGGQRVSWPALPSHLMRLVHRISRLPGCDQFRDGRTDVGCTRLATHVAGFGATFAQQGLDGVDDGLAGGGFPQMLQHQRG
jgi:hypothetical protein